MKLTPLGSADLDEVFGVYSDPDTWRHFPEGRHADRETTAAFLALAERSWQTAGLGPWALRVDGTFIGTGGVSLSRLGMWNLGYRLAPAAWGHGYATEVARAAVEAADHWPVTARVMSSNPASQRVLERVGLELVYEGPLPGERLRRIYADRPLDSQLLHDLIALG